VVWLEDVMKVPRVVGEMRNIASAFRGLVILGGPAYTADQRDLLNGMAARLDEEAEKVRRLLAAAMAKDSARIKTALKEVL
jgi:hypothetical protein